MVKFKIESWERFHKMTLLVIGVGLGLWFGWALSACIVVTADTVLGIFIGISWFLSQWDMGLFYFVTLRCWASFLVVSIITVVVRHALK